MEESTYSIELADGTVINGLTLNGNNFVSLAPVDPAIFANNLHPVVITETPVEGDPVVEEHEYMDLVQVSKMGNEHWFILRDILDGELDNIKIRADVDFIAMMTDIELNF